MISLYLHIPFCEVKCGYCDFFSVPRGFEDFDLQKEYVRALTQEIEERSRAYVNTPVHTIFFGGGTPSLLDPALMEEILKTLQKHWKWSSDTEMTMESNPKTVSLEKLKAFRSLGFNRLSVGVQSFQDNFLKTLGRVHEGGDAIRTLKEARQAGFENVSCDLIFALPNQTLEMWKQDVEQALSLGTDHLSAYHLTIEGGTAFESLYRQGKLKLPEDEVGVEMLLWTRERLQQAGFDPYEISNFSKPGRACQHNQNYWHYGEYLGFGTGAASFTKEKNGDVFGVRRHNVKNLKKYIEGQFLDFDDRIARDVAMGEFCFLTLRTPEGLSKRDFKNEFGKELSEVFPQVLKKNADKGWIQETDIAWCLTPAGLLWADEVATSFLP